MPSAGVVELVDTPGLGPGGRLAREGSSPFSGTRNIHEDFHNKGLKPLVGRINADRINVGRTLIGSPLVTRPLVLKSGSEHYSS